MTRYLCVVLCIVLSLSACTNARTGAGQGPSTTPPARDHGADLEGSVDNPDNTQLGVVAVAEIGLTQRAAKLALSEQALRDAASAHIAASARFRVIDWKRLNAVLFRRNLEWSDVVRNEEARESVRDVLLNDYFLVGSVTAFGERLEYESSALSKQKTQVVNVGLDLFLKDAFTNEIVASGHGQAEERRTLKQALGFGASGGADPALAAKAAKKAIGQALEEATAVLTSKRAEEIQ